MDDDSKALKDQRIQVLMSEGEVKAIDDWAFAHRIRSRGEAIRLTAHMAMSIEGRVPELFRRINEASDELSKARAAWRTARTAQPVDGTELMVAGLGQEVAAIEMTMAAIVAFSELLVLIAPLSGGGDDFSKALEQRRELERAVAELDPKSREHRERLQKFLRSVPTKGVDKPE